MRLLYVLHKLIPWILIFLVAFLGWRACSGSIKELLAGKRDVEVEVTHNTILTKIEEMGKLELVRYNFKDVVEYSKEVSRFLPNSKVALIVSGEAVGCIDLQKLQPSDLQFLGDTALHISLPAPEICYYRVNHTESKVFGKENTYFQDAELVDEGYKFAEKNVKQAALNSGILKQTSINAEKILKPMLENMTGRKVYLMPRETMQAPPVPKKR
ncbi:hypothetical protein TH61_07520 [Rufibacter sp. DG15C]|uniref:DUF4230 domain-containing protein n=1 Tax=Rufibacter sp. DG15C TaxID=1379909 RepID=UPI00078C9E3A|nr:DUF4230 domain-containing protein [Rufibacter sp. DG15C]AMM51060.1 hypothetical protein TH61_07520 [Rufibacter sp. DG15C]